MKKMSILLLLIAVLIIQTIQSCKKYPEGPELSIKTRAERVSNSWIVENYKINGNDFTSLASGYHETFSKDGAYSYSWGILGGSKTWSFQNNDLEIKLAEKDDPTSFRTLFILKLEEKSFWYYYLDGSDRYEIHLIPN